MSQKINDASIRTNAMWAHRVANCCVGRSNTSMGEPVHEAITYLGLVADGQVSPTESAIRAAIVRCAPVGAATKGNAMWAKHNSINKLVAAAQMLPVKAAAPTKRAPKEKATPKVKGGRSRVQAEVTSFTNAEVAADAPIPMDTGLSDRVNGLEAKANSMEQKLDAILAALSR